MRRRWFESWLMVGAVLATGVGACGRDKPEAHKECTTGLEGCECFADATCKTGLSCFSNLCVAIPGGVGGFGGMSGAFGTSLGGTSGQGKGGSSARGGNAGAGGMEDLSGTPVGIHGALTVSGANLVDAAGKPVKLEGMSSMWLNWDGAGYATNKDGLRFMRDNWNLKIFRIAMGVAEEGGYLEDAAKAKEQVNRIVQNAIDLGVYVIIDWHDHEALAHRVEAQAFFAEMAQTWGEYPNVLYEVFNEPLDLNWSSELKPYHQALVGTIRQHDSDNVILLGTPNWDQDVDVAAASPLSGNNLMYTLHFYACTHQANELAKAMTARTRGLPLFVSEWGATHANGGLDGKVCESEALTWHRWLDQANISWTAWKLDGCTDSSCMFKDRTVSVNGGWSSPDLNGHAPFVIEQMKGEGGANTGAGGTSSTGGRTGAGGASSSGGKTALGGAPGSGGTSAVDPFPPDPSACVLVESCPSCCDTVGVFALDSEAFDVTGQVVTAFDVTDTAASAGFSFKGVDQVGAIFFKFKDGQNIGALGVSATGSGGSLEIALVSDGGANGCIYPVIGGEFDPFPTTCWGDGAGPYADYPADQIEVRVRSRSSGVASLGVTRLTYEP